MTMNPHAAEPARRSPLRRWFRRAVLIVVGLLLLLVAAVQITLWTDFPRRLVLHLVERQSGLRISADELSTGWFGHTALRNVKISLPLANPSQPMLSVPELHLEHTWLISIVLLDRFRLEELVLENPVLTLRQSPSGIWDATEAAAVIGRGVAARAANAASGPTPTRQLFRVRIADAVVRVIDNQSRETRIEPLSFTLLPHGPLVYRCEAAVPDHLSLTGELVPGTIWQHELKLSAKDIHGWIRPFIRGLPANTQLAATWRGQQDQQGGVRGSLDVESFACGRIAASGPARVALSAQAIDVRPEGMLVRTGEAEFGELRLVGGAMRATARTLALDALQLRVAGGPAEVSGQWDRAEGTADVTAQWREVPLPARAKESGRITASLRRPWPGGPRIEATVSSAGVLDEGQQWDTTFRLTGSGSDFTAMDWVATIDQFTFAGERETTLRDITAKFRTRGQLISLEDLQAARIPKLSARGEMRLDTRRWWLWVRGDEIAVPARYGSRLLFDVNASGEARATDRTTLEPAHFTLVDNIYVCLGDVECTARGFYDSTIAQPLQLDLWIAQRPTAGTNPDAYLRGRLRVDAHASGSLRPIDVKLAGYARGRNVVLNNRQLGDLLADIKGTVTPTHVELGTARLKLFGGQWDATCKWPIDFPETPIELEVAGRSFSLDQLLAGLNARGLAGTADGSSRILISDFARDRIQASGQFDVREFTAPGFVAPQVTGRIQLADGALRFDTIEARNGGGVMHATAATTLSRASAWDITADVSDWPYRIHQADADMLLTGKAQLGLDLVRKTATGPLNLSAALDARGTPLGTASLDARFTGRQLDVDRFALDALDGTVRGRGSYGFESPLRTAVDLSLTNIDARKLALYVPQMRGIAGKLDGVIVSGPDDNPRALEPWRLNVSLRAVDGRCGDLPWERVDLTAYANNSRAVAESLHLRVADGEVRGFGRISRHNQGVVTSQLQLSFDNLNLDQIVHALEPRADSMPGRLSGIITLAGDPRDPRSVFGNLLLNLTQANLVNVDAVALLYNLMRVGAKTDQPTGHGTARARIENNMLDITEARIFNHGVEMRGIGVIRELFKIPDSPINATLVGSARPFKDINFPFFASMDQMFSVLQSNVTTVRVNGTLRNPQVRSATFDEVNSSLRLILLGEARSDN